MSVRERERDQLRLCFAKGGSKWYEYFSTESKI